MGMRHGQSRWEQLPTRGEHPHSLSEAVGLTLSVAVEGKALGVVFGGYFNSAYIPGRLLGTQEDVHNCRYGRSILSLL